MQTMTQSGSFLWRNSLPPVNLSRLPPNLTL
jgi:hypothetical protein